MLIESPEKRHTMEMEDNPLHIPGSRDNPVFLWVDDAKVVGDLIAPGTPVPGHLFAQEVQHREAEFLEGGIALVVSGVSVHQSP